MIARHLSIAGSVDGVYFDSEDLYIEIFIEYGGRGARVMTLLDRRVVPLKWTEKPLPRNWMVI